MKATLALAAIASGIVHSCVTPANFELRVATFNAGLAPGFVEHTAERVAPVVSTLGQSAKQLDALCVQEFWLEDHFASLRDTAKTELPYSVRKPPRPGSGTCGGEELSTLGQCLQASCAGASDTDLVGCAEANCVAEVTALTPGCLGCILNHLSDDFSVCAGPAGPSDPAIYGGAFDVGLLSRYPILESDTRELSSYFVRAAALYAKVDVPGAGPVHVFCTHLGSSLDIVPYGGKNGSWHDEQRQQITELLSFVHDKTHGSERVLLLGDMNNGPDSSAVRGDWADNYAALVGNGLDDPYLAQGNASCTWCPNNSFHPDATPTLIDHILANGFEDASITTERAYTAPISLTVDGTPLGSNLSDHYGLRSTIRRRQK